MAASKVLGRGGEAGDIGEDSGDLAVLATEAGQGVALHHLADDAWVEVALEAAA